MTRILPRGRCRDCGYDYENLILNDLEKEVQKLRQAIITLSTEFASNGEFTKASQTMALLGSSGIRNS